MLISRMHRKIVTFVIEHDLMALGLAAKWLLTWFPV